MHVGGAARFLLEARAEADVRSALAWASEHGLTTRVLGGGFIQSAVAATHVPLMRDVRVASGAGRM